jgi:hypothetical protein
MEGPGLVHILASPLKRNKFFLFKLLFFTIPQVIIGIILFFTADITLQLDPFFRFTGIVFLLPSIFFLSILAFFFGLQVKESIPLTPQHLIVSKAGISYMLWGLAYVVFCMIYFIRPLFLYYFSIYKKQTVPIFEILLWLLGFMVFNFLIASFFFKKSQKLWNQREFI